MVNLKKKLSLWTSRSNVVAKMSIWVGKSNWKSCWLFSNSNCYIESPINEQQTGLFLSLINENVYGEFVMRVCVAR